MVMLLDYGLYQRFSPASKQKTCSAFTQKPLNALTRLREKGASRARTSIVDLHARTRLLSDGGNLIGLVICHRVLHGSETMFGGLTLYELRQL